MDFENVVENVKRNLPRDFHLFPVVHLSDGTNVIDTLIQTPGAVVKYNHSWKYSPDGQSISGIESITDHGLRREGKTWTMEYSGTTILQGLDKMDLCGIYDFRTKFWSNGTFGDRPRNPALSGPILKTACLKGVNLRHKNMHYRFKGWTNEFEGTEVISLGRHLAFQLDMYGGFK